MSRYSFIINQGATFRRRIQYKDSSNLPVDLTDYQARMYIKPTPESSTIYCRLSSSLDADYTGLNMTPVSASLILPKTSGSIGIWISAASSSLFNFTEAYGDIFIYSGSGITQYSKKIADIKFKLQKSSTIG